MAHKLGVYYSPGHNRPADLDYIVRLQSPVVRILDPDVSQICAVHQAVPNALIMLRYWWLDDGRNRDTDPHGQLGQLTANPVETAYRHAMEWKRETDRLRNEAAQRGLTFPPVKQLMVSGVNEPNEAADAGNDVEYHALELKIAQYTSTFLDACYGYGLRAAALCLGVGHPARQLADGTPDWSRYMSIQAALTRGNHAVDLHAYWYMSGPQDGFGWYFGREKHCPLQAPIIVGETGVDNGVDRDRWHNERPDGARGWRGNIDAATYADQIMWALDHLDPRVIAILPFTTDVRSDDWGAFDTLDAHESILAAMQTKPTVTPPTVYIPTLPNDGPAPPKAEPPSPVGIITPAALEAILEVESNGNGFVEQRMVIRFEAHIFVREFGLTEYFRYNDARRPWLEQFWRPSVQDTWRAIHTGRQDSEWAAFEFARSLNETAAMKAISMGASQIMGFNHQRIGYSTVQAMFRAFDVSYPAQLIGLVNFILSDTVLVDAVRRRDWRTVARLYNGPGQVDTYAPRLEKAYREASV